MALRSRSQSSWSPALALRYFLEGNPDVPLLSPISRHLAGNGSVYDRLLDLDL